MKLVVTSRRLITCATWRSQAQGKSAWKRSKDRKLIDWKKVRVQGGSGGDGCVSFRRVPRIRFGGPDGGNGGSGGGVTFTADSSVRSLRPLKTNYRGGTGGSGMKAYRRGKDGQNIIVKVPPGTAIKDTSTETVLADLMCSGDSCEVVRGGEGGLGNTMFESVVHRRPREHTSGEKGEEKVIELEMKSIADVGLVGFPNAGKSTLLRALSRAKPTVAAYPFTTLNPHIGVMMGSGEDRIAIADIPGLIPGAHEDRGLGHSFLRHVERCSILLYVLDASSEDPDMSSQLSALQYELACYSSTLCDRAKLIVVNKVDVRGPEEVAETGLHTELPIVLVSALKQWNIVVLKETLTQLYHHSDDSHQTTQQS